MEEFLILLAMGVGAGALGSLVGAGGGFLLVPALLLMYPEQATAQVAAVSLIVVFFTAFSGSINYAWMQRIDYQAGVAFAVAAAPTAMLGAYLSHYVPRAYFDPAMALLLVSVAIFLVLRPPQNKAGADGATSLPQRHLGPRGLSLGCVLNAYIGLLSGLMGIGGGVVGVPILVKVLRFSPHVAAATSLFALTITAFCGVLVHVVHDRLSQLGDIALFLAMGVLVGAQLGPKISTHLKGTGLLRVLAVVLGCVGGRILWSTFFD
ncbi:MAG: TSUP family transporter [Candidatus Latescibacteria bacterium]|nr:TSUP family transporter [Candidatus Latescibacterota bacterium]